MGRRRLHAPAVEQDGRVYQGKGFDTDIVEASALAFLQAINRICADRGIRERAQPEKSAAAGGA